MSMQMYGKTGGLFTIIYPLKNVAIKDNCFGKNG